MKSEKIAASICWLTAALLFAVDQINLIWLTSVWQLWDIPLILDI